MNKLVRTASICIITVVIDIITLYNTFLSNEEKLSQIPCDEIQPMNWNLALLKHIRLKSGVIYFPFREVITDALH